MNTNTAKLSIVNTPRKARNTPVVRVKHKKTAQQAIAAIAAGFLPVASYVIAHVEAPADPKLYGLVACALAYSAPTLIKWAERWAGHWIKASGFAILLEGVMVLSHIQWLNLTGLGILVVINSFTAFAKGAK